MYQIVGADGVPGDPLDLPMLKEMAADGRVVPATIVLDPISGRSAPAGEMFVGDELFAIVDPIAAPSGSVAEAGVAAAEPAPSEPITPTEPVAVSVAAPPTPAAVAPDVSQTPAPTPPTTSTFSVTLPTYPSLATEGIPDLGARFIGLFIDGLISIPLAVLAVIPFVGIIGAPLLCLYMLSRDAFFGGQSIGKRVAKTKVVRLDGSPFTWQYSVMRNIVYVPFLLYMIPIIGVVIGGWLSMLAGIAEVICVVTTQRRIGDYLANTQVVRAE